MVDEDKRRKDEDRRVEEKLMVQRKKTGADNRKCVFFQYDL